MDNTRENNTPSLGIWIPSWNRAHFFNRLISTIDENRDENLKVMVGLNPPSDNYEIPDWCTVIRNKENIGQSRNILQGITLLDTDYIWMIGDDEQIRPGAIKEIRERISTNPGMVICTDGKFDHGPTGDYKNWPEWMDDCIAHNKESMLTVQTLMTSTIFRRAGVNLDIAQHYLDTRYGHHFGIIDGLMWEPVSVTRRPVFISGHSSNSSVHQEPHEYRSIHDAVTVNALYHLIEFCSIKAGKSYPSSCYTGVGFDS